MNLLDAFRAALANAGLKFDGKLEADGKLHRFDAEKETGQASWYVLHLADKFAAGAFGCWRRDKHETWNSANGAELTPEERREIERAKAAATKERKTEEQKLRSEAKKAAQRLLDNALFPVPSHPYLERKHVKAHGEMRFDPKKETLILPLRTADGVLQSAQLIAPDKRYGPPSHQRDKTYLLGGATNGAYYVLHEQSSGPILIAEGYATAATVHEATGYTTIAAMSAANLLPVAKDIRKQFPTRIIIIAADNDRFNSNGHHENIGITKATAAAQAINGFVAIPEFADIDTSSTDFNDLALISGLDAVRKAITAVMPVVATPIGNLTRAIENDPNELLKFRFLCRRMSLLFVGSTGKGKSSCLLQASACWSVGRDFFGIQPTRPLRTLYIQAENDDGDIAAIRDGIVTGLQFTEQERELFFQNVLVYTETALTGKRFCNEIIRPLLDFHHSDICAIDPVLSYLGGDTKEQSVVGAFLRNYLNPVLYDFDCAAFVNHHTNKSASHEDNASDFAYYGSGSAEWANWARAILALQPTKSKSVFKLHIAKRGQKLGWKSKSGETLYHKHIAHSSDSNIFWHEAASSEIPKHGPSNSKKIEKLLAPLLISSLSNKDWAKFAWDKLNIPRTSFDRYKDQLEADGRIFQSKINDNWSAVIDPSQ